MENKQSNTGTNVAILLFIGTGVAIFLFVLRVSVKLIGKFYGQAAVQGIGNFVNTILTAAIWIGIVYVVLRVFGKAKYRRCPKCESENLSVVKRKVPFGHYITLFFTPPPMNLFVCKDCGFSWEDR